MYIYSACKPIYNSWLNIFFLLILASGWYQTQFLLILSFILEHGTYFLIFFVCLMLLCAFSVRFSYWILNVETLNSVMFLWRLICVLKKKKNYFSRIKLPNSVFWNSPWLFHLSPSALCSRLLEMSFLLSMYSVIVSQGFRWIFIFIFGDQSLQ